MENQEAKTQNSGCGFLILCATNTLQNSCSPASLKIEVAKGLKRDLFTRSTREPQSVSVSLQSHFLLWPILQTSRSKTERVSTHKNVLLYSQDWSAHFYRFTVFLGASGTVRIDESGDRDPDYSLKYYVNGSFQNIADYNHSTGGFNLRGDFLFFLDVTSNSHD